MRSKIELSSTLVEKDISIGNVMKFQAGDVIPIEMPETVLLTASDIPIFRGKLGISDGNYAVQILEKLTQDSV
jgi:flagellar motor switch protein FliM